MKTSFKFLVALVALLAPAAVFAQPGPGPTPNPWLLNSAQVYYNRGCVTVSVTAPGACHGAGSFSADTVYVATSINGTNVAALGFVAQIATNTVLGNATSGTANISAQAMPSCSTSTSALKWTTNTGFGCTSLSSSVVTTLNFGTIGFTPSSATSGAITVAGTLIPANGGTGFGSYAVGDTLYADTTTSLAKLADVATGNAMISGGIGVAPSWGKIGLTTHVTGTLAVGNGGTGLASFVTGDVPYASATTTLAGLADIATGNALITGGVGVAPSYGKIGLTTHVSGTLGPTNGGTGFASYAVGDLLYADTTTSLAKRAAVAAGQALMSAGTSTAPAYTGSPSFSGSVTAATGLTVSAGGAAITGNSSISSGSFTASGGTFTASPASANVVLSPTGTGIVTINPATAGTLNNVVIGGSTPLAGTFTTATANTSFRGTDFGSGSSSTVAITTTGGTQLQVTNTASAARNVTITGSAAGNPTIATTAGSLAITPAIVGASTISDSVGNVRSILQSGSDKTGSYTLATTDNGQFIGVGSGGSITIPDATFSNGMAVTLFNNTTGNITITCTITTAYIAGTDADKATMTLATRGLATLLFYSGTIVVVSGNVS